MKFATLKSTSPDGQLVVVSRDQRFAKAVPDIASTLQQALDRWEEVSGALKRVYDDINESSDLLPKGVVAFNPNEASSPLPPRTVSSNSPGCGRSNSATREAGHGWFFSLTLFPWQEFRRPA